MFDHARLLAETFVRRIDFHEELPSTNDRALRLASDESLETPLLVLTERQTAGRGRGANRWWSNPGALTFSLVGDFTLGLPPEVWSRLSLVAALAVCEALESFAPRHEVAVKWPNDVFLERKKVCGILIESPGRPSGRTVVGIGVNVNNSFASAPSELQAIATSLGDVLGIHVCRGELLIRVLDRLERWIASLSRGADEWLEAWRPRCLLSGRTVTIDDGKRRTTGVCQGLAADGALRLRTHDGLETFYSGVVRGVE